MVITIASLRIKTMMKKVRKKVDRSFAKRLRERQFGELLADMQMFEAGRTYHEDSESFADLGPDEKAIYEAFERFYLEKKDRWTP